MTKKIFIFSIWLLLIAGIIASLILVNKQNRNIVCSKVNVSINYQDQSILIAEDDILNIIKSNQGNLIGKKISLINVFELEKLLKQNPFILNADVFSSVNGVINIIIKQRKPIIRIFNNKNDKFLIDNNGREMPLNPKYPSRLIIASGNIYDKYSNSAFLDTIGDKNYDSIKKTTNLYKIFRLAQYIENDNFWKAQINQIYVNADNEFELIPYLGNHVIIFGNIDEMKEKFDKLIVFYRQGLNAIGWKKYKIINLKFKNQVVCS